MTIEEIMTKSVKDYGAVLQNGGMPYIISVMPNSESNPDSVIAKVYGNGTDILNMLATQIRYISGESGFSEETFLQILAVAIANQKRGEHNER